MRVDIPVILVVRHQSPMLATVEEDCTSGLVIEVFDDSDTVGADVLLIHSCPQSCMPNPVKGFLEFYEDMVTAVHSRPFSFSASGRNEVKNAVCTA